MGCLPDTSDQQTPLQVSLQELGVKIGYLAMAVCVVVWVTGVALNRQDEERKKPTYIYMTLIAITLAVAAIPEGIPLCVTISLSMGSSSMVKKNVLVRRLAAVETLGSASVICTDKTGTLTEGKMTMVKLWTAGDLFDVSGKGFDPTVGFFTKSAEGTAYKLKGNTATSAARMSTILHEPVDKIEVEDTTGDGSNDHAPLRSTLMSGVLCCNTIVQQEEDNNGNVLWKPKGNSSEAPIVVAAAKVGFWVSDIEAKYKRCLEIPFNSSRKMMLTIVEVPTGERFIGDKGVPYANIDDPDKPTRYMVTVKGAPNIILAKCTKQITKAGGQEAFTDLSNDQAMSVVDDLSSQALRVLAIGTIPLAELPYDPSNDELTSDDKFQACLAKGLCLMGLVASIDPARDGVKEAVAAARDGGIRVIMITGDYLKTAIAIAKGEFACLFCF